MTIHVIPIKDQRKNELFIHTASGRCECYPLEETDDDGTIFIHNAFDTRERFERQEIPGGLGWIQVIEDECEQHDG